MDKYTQMLKMEEIRRLAGKKQYPKAFELLETLDVNKVRTISDLSVFADILEHNKKYEEAMNLLLRIYDRVKTRRVIYQLANLSIKRKDLDEAETYYEEYIKMAPKDPNQFILRFRIDRAKKADLTALISDLENLKQYDYSEEWAYELAKIYHKAGDKEKCIKECSDIILWFGEGVIVEKAKLLKQYYTEGSERFQVIPASKKETESEENKEISDTINENMEEIQQSTENEKIIIATDEAAPTNECILEEEMKIDDRRNIFSLTSNNSEEKNGINNYLEHEMREVDNQISAEREKLEDGHQSPPPVSNINDDLDKGMPAAVQVDEPTDELSINAKEEMEKKEETIIKGIQNDPAEKTDSDAGIVKAEEEDIAEKGLSFSFLSRKPKKIQPTIDINAQIKKMEQKIRMLEEEKKKELSGVKKETLDDQFLKEQKDDNLEKIQEEENIDAYSPVKEGTADLYETNNDSEIILKESHMDVVSEVTLPELGNCKEVKTECNQKKSTAEKIEKEEEIEKKEEYILEETNMTEINGVDLAEIFNDFFSKNSLKKQIMELCSGMIGGGEQRHIMLLGVSESIKADLVKAFAKAFYKLGILPSPKVAMITGDKLNHIDVLKKTNKLSGCMIMIDKAGDMSTSTTNLLIQMMQVLKEQSIVILSDEKEKLEKVLSDVPVLGEYVPYVVDAAK